MAAVSLHPLASRSGAQTSTIVSVELPPDRTPTLSSSAPCEDETDLFGSSPTTRAFSPSFDDAASTIQPNGREWGIHHNDIEQYPILVPGQPRSRSGSMPIRALSADQFADLQRQYAELDVPHSVLFPFLHGVDGDNPAQCAFFHAPLTGQPTPYYRGLTVLRADMPSAEMQHRRERASSSASSKVSTHSHHRSRADSMMTSSSFSADSPSSSEEEVDIGCETNGANINEQRNSVASHGTAVTASNSTSSASSYTSDSRSSSIFSFGSDTTMATQSDVDASKAGANYADHTHSSPHPKAYRNGRHHHGHHRRQRTPVEPQPKHSMLVSTVLPDEVIHPPLVANMCTNGLDVLRQSQPVGEDRCIVKGASFVRPKQADGISLRNFKTQCAKYATISDVVVYSPAGIHEGAMALADWARQAQEACYVDRMQRNLGGLRYNVFVITDTFEVFERTQPHLVAIDGSGFSRNRVDFIEREREEMQRFTEASEIDDNIFVGCSANVPYPIEEYEDDGSSLSLDSYLPHEINPNAFSVCIETAEQAEMPSPARLTHASHYLDAFEATSLFEINSQDALRELEEDGEDVRPSLGPSGWSPTQGRPSSNPKQAAQQVLCPAPSSIVHFRALGSGSGFEDDDQEAEAIDNIVNLCAWMHKQARPSKPAGLLQSSWRSATRIGSWPKHQQQLPRRVLIHCSDGYTDSSILALAYLMYARNLSLSEAYLDLQNRCERCFFVYSRDVPFLQRLEKRIAGEHVKSPSIIEKHRSSWSASEASSRAATQRRHGSGTSRRDSEEPQSEPYGNSGNEQSVWARGLAAATGLVSAAQNNGKRSADMARTTTPIPRRSTPTPQSPHREPHGVDNSWFHNPHFQGSFPSRILPFLYLGNLSHAMNPAMLHALGITHVVSVGESAMVPPSTEDNLLDAAAALQPNRVSKASSSPSSRSHKRRSISEHKSLWEEERMGRISVLDLKNVSDDGIDSLRPHMNRAVEYIEQARLQGGKVLVHCRVGVSRSATICIAYVMAHCDLSMIESFLLVRSRRMNVLTQPTLLFVWELRGFEAHLAKLKRERRENLLVELQQRRNKRSLHRSQREDVEEEEACDSDVSQSLASMSISGDQSVERTSPFKQDLNHEIAIPLGCHRSSSLHHHRHYNHKHQPLTRESLAARQSIFSDEDLRVDIGAGAGSVYGFQVRNHRAKLFNCGSLTRLDYLSAKLTHGYFCKLLTELNARYMVS